MAAATGWLRRYYTLKFNKPTFLDAQCASQFPPRDADWDQSFREISPIASVQPRNGQCAFWSGTPG